MNTSDHFELGSSITIHLDQITLVTREKEEVLIYLKEPPYISIVIGKSSKHYIPFMVWFSQFTTEWKIEERDNE